MKNKVKLGTLEEIKDILNESEELSKEIKTFEGVFAAISTITGAWSILEKDGKRVSGITDNTDLLAGVTTKSVNYKLTCEEVLEIDNVSAKEKTVLKLLEVIFI